MNRMDRDNPVADVTADFQALRSKYLAGLDIVRMDNRFVRRRNGLGGMADAHLTHSELWCVRETARHMVRNDSMPPQALERLADLVAGTGYGWRIEPTTGDDGLDKDLAARFSGWAADKTQCDFMRRRTLYDMVWASVFQIPMDGDLFAILTKEGSVEMVEGDRCVPPPASPTSFASEAQRAAAACGVETTAAGIPVAFWFTKASAPHLSSREDVERRPIFDDRGVQVACQMFRPHRASQNRGYSWLLPVMVESGMLEDLDFALVLKAQMAAAVSYVTETDPAAPPAPQTVLGAETATRGDNNDPLTTTKIRPGMGVDLPKGRKLSGFSPVVANSEHFQHAMYLLRKFAGAVGLPYFILCLDATDTNFSSWRGTADVAKASWRRFQRVILGEQFLLPVYRWKLMRWLPEMGRSASRIAAKGRYTSCRLITPGWPYTDPEADVKAERGALEGHLNSPTGVLGSRGVEFADVAKEIVRDRSFLVRLAIAEAEAIGAKHPNSGVTWRDLLDVGSMVETPAQNKPADKAQQNGAK